MSTADGKVEIKVSLPAWLVTALDTEIRATDLAWNEGIEALLNAYFEPRPAMPITRYRWKELTDRLRRHELPDGVEAHEVPGQTEVAPRALLDMASNELLDPLGAPPADPLENQLRRRTHGSR